MKPHVGQVEPVSETQPKSTKSEQDFLGLKPGIVLDGRFVVEDLIGAGGQGMVFRVRHLEWNQDFALKLPLPEVIESSAARERFIKEAETWIRMGVHPNIVRCWFVRPVSGLPGLFLDLIGGGSLEDKIKSGAVAPGHWETILLTLIQVAEGLTHSHAKGVVHRDLKPENLMVKTTGELCITDFGLVKTLTDVELHGALDSFLPEKNTVTEGQMGTPRYGAPEQWIDPASVSPTTDIYSFGAIMFELICGRRPFEPPGESTDPLTLINKHIMEPPPDPLSLQPEIPKPLSELCLQCLEKGAADRPQTAVEVLQHLKEILSQTCNRSYSRPAPVPAGDRPDLLNNAATSLFSVGRSEAARALLLKGLMLEAGHTQCLFNLIQLDRREGKIGRAESFRRLKRAKAHLELALLYLEEGLGSKASEHLERLSEEEKSGYIYRTEGDAYMYTQRYKKAEESYAKAVALMPSDEACRFRYELAKTRTNRADGRLYFPALTPAFSSRAHNHQVKILLDPSGTNILGISEQEVVVLSTSQNTILGKATRPSSASAVRKAYCSGERLILQDSTGFELWSLRELSLRKRQQGLVLAANKMLNHLIFLLPSGVVFYDVVRDQGAPLNFPPETKPSRHVLASFNPSQNGVGILTPDGSVASVQGQNVVPFSWPPPLPDTSQICDFKLGNNRVIVVDCQGVVQCLNLSDKCLAYSYNLGFVPESIESDSSGDVLVFSSPQAFTILDSAGNRLLRGRGPFAVSADGRFGLVWRNGVITLYQLAPFHLVRSWSEQIAQPHSISFAANGSRAVSMDGQGQYQVWEVDEANRVYERNLLVTPGESYGQLIDSFERHLQQYQEAVVLAEQNAFKEAYKTLKSARSVPGFQQAELALNLQWTLCGKLQREGLEAIWERLYIPDVVEAQLSADCRHLLIVKAEQAELFQLSGPRITQKRLIPSRQELIGGAYLSSHSEQETVVSLSRHGLVAYTDVQTGETTHTEELALGRLSLCKFETTTALIHTELGEIVTWDLLTRSTISRVELGERELESAFLLSGKKCMIVSPREFLVLDQVKSTLTPGLPLTLERLPGSISFVGDNEAAQLRMTGFSDGTLIISHLKTGDPLLGINQENGPVSGACLHVDAALGISVSDSGGITLFGLDTGRILERFVAHADGIAEITITDDGRYVTTRSTQGQFRLWEISWLLSDRPGNRKIDWLPTPKGLAKLGKFFRR